MIDENFSKKGTLLSMNKVEIVDFLKLLASQRTSP